MVSTPRRAASTHGPGVGRVLHLVGLGGLGVRAGDREEAALAQHRQRAGGVRGDVLAGPVDHRLQEGLHRGRLAAGSPAAPTRWHGATELVGRGSCWVIVGSITGRWVWAEIFPAGYLGGRTSGRACSRGRGPLRQVLRCEARARRRLPTIRPSSVRIRVTVCPHGSVRAGWSSSKPARSSSPPAAATASASSTSNSIRCLGDHPVGGPRRRAEARLGRLRERPHAEVLAAGDVLTGVVLIGFVLRQRQAEGVDEQLATLRRVSGDDRHAGDEQNVHEAELRPAAEDAERLPRTVGVTDGSPTRDRLRAPDA